MHSRGSDLLSVEEAHNGRVKNPLDDAREIGCYSVDAQKCIHYDRSQMKYYIRRVEKNLHLDLNVGCENDIRQPHDRVQIMNDLLRWIVNSRFEPLHEYSIHFVCTRSIIRALLKPPYSRLCRDSSKHWIICACRVDDVIYLNIVDTCDRFAKELAAPEYEQRCMAWGFKFEQYMTADSPDGTPDLTSTTLQVDKFYIVIKNRIGSYNLLISAEVDGIDPSSSRPGNGDPSCYVEMKTSKLVPNFLSTSSFQRNKSFKWWRQSVCSGVEKIICGFRDEEGIVRDIKVFNTSDLASSRENKWSPRVCMNFCHNVLHYLRKRMTVNDPRIVYRCEYTGGSTVSVTREENPTGPFNLIPDWYEAELRKC